MHNIFPRLTLLITLTWKRKKEEVNWFPPCLAVHYHTLTVMAAEGCAAEFTLPGFSTCTCHKPKPCTFWEGLCVISSVLYFAHGFLVVTFCICSKGFFSVYM